MLYDEQDDAFFHVQPKKMKRHIKKLSKKKFLTDDEKLELELCKDILERELTARHILAQGTHDFEISKR